MIRKLYLGAIVAFLAVFAIACSSDDNGDTTGATGAATSTAVATGATGATGDTGATGATGATGTSDRDSATGSITVYSGRAEALVGPLIEQFQRDTGITVEVRYGGSAAMAATIAEEGDASPADVFWSQDPGPLGALSDRFAELPEDILARVPEGFQSPDGTWIGVSGRVRIIVYNTENVDPAELPDSMQGLTEPEWQGRVGWAPTNAGFQVMLTSMRVLLGEDAAREWLEAMRDNGAQPYGNNRAVLAAVADGEVDVGIINHYYLHAARRTDPDIAAENHYLNNEDPGSLIMVAGAGILSTSDNLPAAERFVDYLLSPAAQQYFATDTSEYPLIEGVIANPDLQALDSLIGPDIELSDLSDVEGTLALLRETGLVE